MIKRIQFAMVLLMLAGAGSMAVADTPATPFPWVVTSERGDYLFKMVSPKWRHAFGVAYKLDEEGEFTGGI